MYIKQKSLKIGSRLLALLLSILFLFAGCGGEDKPFKQLCDITSKTGGKPRITDLRESGDRFTDSVIITDFEAYENARNQLKTGNWVELPKIKEKVFQEDVILVIVYTLSDIIDYEYRVTDISTDQKTLFVQAELLQNPHQGGDQQVCYQVVLMKLDKELAQDIEKVSVKTEYIDKTDTEHS